MHLPNGILELWFSPSDAKGLDILAKMGLGWLSRDERHRYDGFGVPEAARRFAAGRALMRSVVGGYLGIAPQSLEIEIETGGKPFAPVAKAAGLAFNLTHDADDVVFAVARAGGVGVDVLSFARRDQAMRIAAMMFSVDEYTRISDAKADPLRVLKVCALKESAAKAEGISVWKAIKGYTFDFKDDANMDSPSGNCHWVGTYRDRCVLAISLGSTDGRQGATMTIRSNVLCGSPLTDAELSLTDRV